MGDMIVGSSACLGVVLASPPPEEKITVAFRRGLMTFEFFGEALLLSR